MPVLYLKELKIIFFGATAGHLGGQSILEIAVNSDSTHVFFI